VLEHRHPRVFSHEADQALTAAWNREVDQIVEPEQRERGFALRRRQQRHCRARQPLGLERLLEHAR
jgi:hypothetical protein